MTAHTVLPAHAPRRSRRLGLTGVATALVVVGAVASLGGVAEAGGKTTTTQKASIAVNQAAPALGDVVDFSVSFGSYRLKTPVVSVSCFQSGAKVWGSNIGPSEQVKLGGDWSPWLQVGGASTCTATLQDMSWVGGKQTVTVYASTAFDAAG